MLKRYICLLSVVLLSLVASNYSHAIEIKEIYKLTPEDAEIQSNLNDYYFNNAEKNAGIKGDFELESAWLEPKDTIFASNGYILYWINIHDAKFYDKFIWDYFIPILSAQTGIPTGEYETIYSGGSYLIYMPPDSSKTDTRYWEPYWSYWWSSYQRIDFFNPDSCWAFGVGYSFLDFYTYMRDPGVWKTEVNMATETDITPKLLCDTLFYVIDDIPPNAYIINLQDSSYVGDTFTIQATGWDNAFVEKIELYIDGVLVKTVAESPLEYLWTVPQDEEIHILQSKAYDVNNPPLQLGLCGVSKSYRVSRTNVQATQIVALADNGRVPLFSVQNDTVFKAHFNSLNDLAIDQNLPIGISVDFQKQLRFIINLNLECFNFGQPSTWKPTCKYSIDITGFGGTEAKGEFVGWNGNITVDKTFKHVSTNTFGIHTLTVKLVFEDPSGTVISEQQIVLPCWVFFEKYGGSIAPKYYADINNDGAPNWFEYWADLPTLYKNIFYETYQAKYMYDMADDDYGVFYNITPKYYYIGPIVGYNTGIILTDQNPDIIGHWTKNFKGIHAFSVICRHENLHQTQFETWWGSFREYTTRQFEEDFDRDGVPESVEIIFGTSPLLKDTDGDGLWDADEIICRYHEIWYTEIVEGKPFDLIDWANPGKQTYPQE